MLKSWLFLFPAIFPLTASATLLHYDADPGACFFHVRYQEPGGPWPTFAQDIAMSGGYLEADDASGAARLFLTFDGTSEGITSGAVNVYPASLLSGGTFDVSTAGYSTSADDVGLDENGELARLSSSMGGVMTFGDGSSIEMIQLSRFSGPGAGFRLLAPGVIASGGAYDGPYSPDSPYMEWDFRLELTRAETRAVPEPASAALLLLAPFARRRRGFPAFLASRAVRTCSRLAS